jgi:hypothetical protein
VHQEIAMNVQIPRLSASSQTLIDKYLPVLIALGVAWLCARGLKKLFWTAFGLYWAFHWTHWMH